MTGWLSRRRRRIVPAAGAEVEPDRPRVLLVEDDVHDRERIIPVLDTLGFAVDIAVDVESGLQQEGRREYAGAIVDLNLSSPNLSSPFRCEGFGLIAELRALRRRYPIVIVSYNRGTEYEFRGFEAGADDYIVKWPPGEEMRARLGRLIPGGAGQDRVMRRAGHGESTTEG